MSRPTRQELYDRIRQTSRAEVILEEMTRLGFWPREKDSPDDPAEEIRQRGELQRRLRELRSKNSRLYNIEALQREARKRRMAESKRKRAERKERLLRERAERAEAWKAKKAQDIIYLGDGVSAGLSNREGNRERLQASGLPALFTAADVAGAMGITVGELRFLAFTRQVARTSHYRRFKIAKRTGGERLISAPMPRLLKSQHWVLEHVLERSEPHAAAHGFRKGRSIVSNARPHVGKEVVVNLDLKDFFPTVSYRRVKGLFTHLGYSEAVAVIFALLCTEPEIAETELDGTTYHVAVGGRFLPQGAPTSPAITNLLCRRLDRRLTGASQKLGFAYTRYADDLSFSGSGPASDNVGRLLRQVEFIVVEEGFVVHPDKTRVFRKGRRQEVTGIVVNERPNIARVTLKRFRATLFQIEKDGPEGKHWGQSDDVIASVVGFANYVAMVNPEKGRPLQKRARALADRYGYQPPPPEPDDDPEPEGRDSGPEESTAAEPAAEQSSSDKPESAPEPAKKKKKKWWKIF